VIAPIPGRPAPIPGRPTRKQATRNAGKPPIPGRPTRKQATRNAGKPPIPGKLRATPQATRKGWPYYIRSLARLCERWQWSYIVGPPLAGGLRRVRGAIP